MNYQPLVAIIVPVYNVEKYLAECLESLGQQTYQKIQIYAVNDGSDDRSREILDNYAEKMPNLKVFHKPNGGVSSARNVALNKLEDKECDFICFVDADDKVSPTFVEDFISAIKHQGVNFAICGVAMFDKTGVINAEKTDHSQFRLLEEDIPYQYFAISKWSNRSSASTRFLSNRFFPYEAIKDLRFREDMVTCEDQDFFFKATENLKTGVLLVKQNYFYRLRRSSLSHCHHKLEDELLFYIDLLKKNPYKRSTMHGIELTAMNCWWWLLQNSFQEKVTKNLTICKAAYDFFKIHRFKEVLDNKYRKRFLFYKFGNIFLRILFLLKKSKWKSKKLDEINFFE